MLKSKLVKDLCRVFASSLLVFFGLVTTSANAQDARADWRRLENEGMQKMLDQQAIDDEGLQEVTPQSSSTASQADVRRVDNEIDARNSEEINNDCPQSYVAAQNACMNPMGGMASEEGLAAAGGAIQSLGMLAQLSGKSTQEYCSLLKGGGNVLTGLNTGLGARCLQAAQSCVSSCRSASENSKLDYSTYTAKCEAFRVKSADYAKAALSSGFSAKMFAECEDAASSGGPQLNVGGDTSKPDCTNPANYQNPACAHFYQQNPTGQGFVASKASEIGGDGGAGWEEGDPQQDPDYGGGQHRQALQGFQQQGGGGMQGGTGELPNGGDEGQGGYGGGPNTDVLGGERGGGGGGSVARMGFESGGAGGAVARKPKGSSFDLSKYLPQMKKDAKAMARAPAGLMRANSEIAPMTGNIFKNITDRMKALCHQKRLMECN